MVRTLNDLFLHTCNLTRPNVIRYKRNRQWADLSLAEFNESVRAFSIALRELGVTPNDRVAILSESRPEWLIADFAILAANAITVPVYPTLTAPQIEAILRDCGAVVVIASTPEQVEKVSAARASCPELRIVISCDEPKGEEVRSFWSLVESARSRDLASVDEWLRRRQPDDVATIVYTSGTTGQSKGAMLTHGNIISNVVGAAEALEFRRAELTLSFLPLSHILERMVNFTYLYVGACIAYVGSRTTIAEDIRELRPEVFTAVPRIFEKLQARILEEVAKSSPARRRVFSWAMRIAEERLPYRMERRGREPLLLSLKSAIADRLVYRKIRQRLGGRLQFIFSGGAPLPPQVAAFFIGMGLEIFEGYGLTETSPVIAANAPRHRRLGTVGKPIPGVEVRIAEDGEILVRGPNVMKGYFGNPAATAEAVDPEGWFHTGDLGEIDRDGFLKITGRKKDLIVNAYGKNVAPQPIEELLKTSKFIATPVLVGDRRPFVGALIVPEFEVLQRELGLSGASKEEIVGHPRAREVIRGELDRFNAQLAPPEQIRKFELLPIEITVESGLLTPSEKVRRREVEKRYAAVIEAMFSGGKAA